MCRRARLLLTLCVSTAACTSWQRVPLTPELYATHPSKLRVMQADSSYLVLGEPDLQGDTLVGTGKGQRVALPINSVQWGETRRVNALKTFGLLSGLVAGYLIGVGIAMGISNGGT